VRVTHYVFSTQIGWATFWVLFSQTHLVTLSTAQLPTKNRCIIARNRSLKLHMCAIDFSASSTLSGRGCSSLLSCSYTCTFVRMTTLPMYQSSKCTRLFVTASMYIQNSKNAVFVSVRMYVCMYVCM
jgi:hypothetical protein